MTVARRRVVASRPDQRAASLTSPWSLTHSASTPSGTRSCGMPGATLTQASRRSRPSTNGHGGVQSSTSKVRPRPVLRAGSANATSKGPVSIAVASATITAPARPSAARLASATATRSGSRSTPAQMMPARAVAIRSPPMPQPRSTTVRVEAAVSRAARWAATGRRVACSRPSGVKYIRAASSPNFSSALRRSVTWVRAAATWAGSDVRRSSVWARSGSSGASAARASRCWPSSVSSHRKASRSTAPVSQQRAAGDAAARDPPFRWCVWHSARASANV